MRNECFSRKFMMSRMLQRAIGFDSPGRLPRAQIFRRRLDLADTVVSAVGSAVPVAGFGTWDFY